MGFHLDTTGNVWLGSGSAGTTLTQAITAGPPNFYVTSAGSIYAAAGTIGGNTLTSTSIKSSNYNQGSAGWIINSDGSAEFESVEIRVAASNEISEDVIPPGAKHIAIGAVPIYDFNGNLNFHPASGKSVIIHNGNPFVIKGETGTAQMKFEGAGAIGDFLFDLDFVSYSGAQSDITRRYSNPSPFTQIREFYFENENTVIFRANEQNADVEFMGDIGMPSNSFLYINGDNGSNGDVLKRTSTGMEWDTVGGASHPDGDHTSFAASGHNHNSSYDNFDHIDINGLQMDSGYGLTIAGGTGISVSSSSNPHTVTITNTASSGGVTSLGDQDNSPQLTGAVQLTTSTSNGYFLSSISGNSGNGQISFNKTSYGYVNTLDPTNSNPKVGISTSDRFSNIYSQSFYGTFYGLNINASSRNIKENIVDTALGLNFINDLPVKDFTMIDTGNYGTQKYTGFIAEDLQDYLTENSLDYKLVEDYSSTYEYNNRCSHVMKCTNECECEMLQGCTCDCCSAYFPREDEDGVIKNYLHETVEECEAYMPDENRHPHLYFNNFIGPLVKAVQELSTQISDLTARIETLEG